MHAAIATKTSATASITASAATTIKAKGIKAKIQLMLRGRLKECKTNYTVCQKEVSEKHYERLELLN